MSAFPGQTPSTEPSSYDICIWTGSGPNNWPAMGIWVQPTVNTVERYRAAGQELPTEEVGSIMMKRAGDHQNTHWSSDNLFAQMDRSAQNDHKSFHKTWLKVLTLYTEALNIGQDPETQGLVRKVTSGRVTVANVYSDRLAMMRIRGTPLPLPSPDEWTVNTKPATNSFEIFPYTQFINNRCFTCIIATQVSRGHHSTQQQSCMTHALLEHEAKRWQPNGLETFSQAKKNKDVQTVDAMWKEHMSQFSEDINCGREPKFFYSLPSHAGITYPIIIDQIYPDADTMQQALCTIVLFEADGLVHQSPNWGIGINKSRKWSASNAGSTAVDQGLSNHQGSTMLTAGGGQIVTVMGEWHYIPEEG